MKHILKVSQGVKEHREERQRKETTKRDKSHSEHPSEGRETKRDGKGTQDSRIALHSNGENRYRAEYCRLLGYMEEDPKESLSGIETLGAFRTLFGWLDGWNELISGRRETGEKRRERESSISFRVLSMKRHGSRHSSL